MDNLLARRRALTAALLGGAVLPRGAHAEARTLKAPLPALWDPVVKPMVQGTARGPNGSIAYRRYGNGPKTTIVTLHGGPAAGHRYLRPYAALATDRPVVFYDQSGCGRSARPADLALYTPERYVDELEALRIRLGLEQMILLGHSWGGLLAPACAATVSLLHDARLAVFDGLSHMAHIEDPARVVAASADFVAAID
ncbi:hypothetical protein BH09PSE6_BH09PSE6_15460 [soil metagenome]